MANDLAKVKETSFLAFSEALAQGTEGAMRAVQRFEGGAPSLSLGMGIGSGAWGVATATEAAASDIDTTKYVLASVNYEKVEFLKWHDIEDNPEIVAQRARLMANRGAAMFRDATATGITGLFSLAHPMAGDRIAAGKFYIDSLLDYGGLGINSQANLLAAAALSQSTFSTARKVLTQYFAQDATLLGMGERVILCVGADHQDVAYELAHSAATGAGLQASASKEAITDVVVIPGLGSKWFVIDANNNPLVGWMRRMPQITVSDSEKDLGVYITGTATYAFGVQPSEAGIVGSNF